ncbi:hypothetical protein PAXRUDRAFT_18891 [Paxillus rubicundulus Ve08.2h10]|uniref:Uncharacterized protein n=1 Tax=Paxillus rubicundulus Ve08.2h10 TaxID=930991 RepID=A0A0D0DDQ5_9AGAM|nr:hypothetical protein PAXRUDRAFT_18891 [Paxillus rubicundulus Ve08.2h10]
MSAVAAVNSIFHPCVVAQHLSSEIVIYACKIGLVVTIAYPISSQGRRVVPNGIFLWKELQGLVWECFCGLVSGQPTPARFINEAFSGHTVVHCYHVKD